MNAYYFAKPVLRCRLAPSNRREKSDPLVSGQNSVPIGGNSLDHDQLYFLLGNCEQPGQGPDRSPRLDADFAARRAVVAGDIFSQSSGKHQPDSQLASSVLNLGSPAVSGSNLR